MEFNAASHRSVDTAPARCRSRNRPDTHVPNDPWWHPPHRPAPPQRNGMHDPGSCDPPPLGTPNDRSNGPLSNRPRARWWDLRYAHGKSRRTRAHVQSARTRTHPLLCETCRCSPNTRGACASLRHPKDPSPCGTCPPLRQTLDTPGQAPTCRPRHAKGPRFSLPCACPCNTRGPRLMPLPWRAGLQQHPWIDIASSSSLASARHSSLPL
mmetsp:Transcript_2691/g.16998  ORF Transcript_2691/g.16998 Transcript_2691/m.16998 type:complete len:210 (-) Transcript_2691:383-1012(-)